MCIKSGYTVLGLFYHISKIYWGQGAYMKIFSLILTKLDPGTTFDTIIVGIWDEKHFSHQGSPLLILRIKNRWATI